MVSGATGDPLRHARVTILASADSPPPIFTDADGRFLLADPPAGRLTITVTKSGYVRTSVPGAYDMEIRLPKAAAIAGRILDEFGDPVVGAMVVAEHAGPRASAADAAIARTTTDDLGEYRIGGLPAGSFVLSAGTAFTNVLNGGTIVYAFNIPGTGPAEIRLDGSTGRMFYPGVADEKDAQPIVLAAGEERPAVDFTIRSSRPNLVSVGDAMGAADSLLPRPSDPKATSAIRGRVLRTDGRPIGRAGVRLTAEARRGFQRFTTTDEDGRYEFTGLVPGDFRVSASKASYQTVEYGQRRPFERGESITVAEGATRRQIDFALPHLLAISGRILDEVGDPVEGAGVRPLQVRFAQGRRRLVEVAGAASRRTDDLGRFRVYGLQPGSYLVSATIGQIDSLSVFNGGQLADIGGYAPTYAPGTVNPLDAQAIVVGSDDVIGVDFSLMAMPTASISGRATWANGDPVTGGLRLAPSRNSAAVMSEVGARIDADGWFAFPNLAPGQYVVQAYRGRANQWTEGDFGSLRVDVAGRNVDGLVLHASPGSAISGRITFEGGLPPPPGDIGLVPSVVDPDLAPFSGIAAGAEIGADWSFRLAGIQGPRRLRVASPPRGWMLKAIFVNGLDVTDTPVQFGAAEQSLKDVEVVLTNRLTRVTGLVSDDRGRPRPDASIIAFAPSREQWYPDSRFLKRVTAGRDGIYDLSRLPPGEYLLAGVDWSATANGDDGWQDPDFLESLTPHASRVMLVEDQSTVVNLTIARR